MASGNFAAASLPLGSVCRRRVDDVFNSHFGDYSGVIEADWIGRCHTPGTGANRGLLRYIAAGAALSFSLRLRQ
jgi:hypothetical protein